MAVPMGELCRQLAYTYWRAPHNWVLDCEAGLNSLIERLYVLPKSGPGTSMYSKVPFNQRVETLMPLWNKDRHLGFTPENAILSSLMWENGETNSKSEHSYEFSVLFCVHFTSWLSKKEGLFPRNTRSMADCFVNFMQFNRCIPGLSCTAPVIYDNTELTTSWQLSAQEIYSGFRIRPRN